MQINTCSKCHDRAFGTIGKITDQTTLLVQHESEDMRPQKHVANELRNRHMHRSNN